MYAQEQGEWVFPTGVPVRHVPIFSFYLFYFFNSRRHKTIQGHSFFNFNFALLGVSRRPLGAAITCI